MTRIALASLLFLLLAAPARGQITINAPDVTSLVGTSETWTSFESNGPAPALQAIVGAAGANRTWDFTTLTWTQGESNVISYYDAPPPGAPGGNTAPFNTANFVQVQESGDDSTSYTYEDFRNDGIYYQGFVSEYGGKEARGVTSPPILALPLPLTYGDTWTTNATSTTTADGVTLSVPEKRVNTVDGWGTLVLPTGSFQVLRVRQDITVTYAGFSTTTTIYFWYSAEFEALASATSIATPFGSFSNAVYFEREGAAAPADAPQGLTPPDAAANQPTTVALDWSDVPGATSYDLQVATDPSFTANAAEATSKSLALVVDEQGLGASGYTVEDLDAGATYYWRVRGANEGGAGPWTAPRSFSTQQAAPDAVALDAPADGVDDQPTSLALRWNAALRADDYHLQVATDAAFTALVVDERGLAETFLDVADLDAGTTYYWRVRGANEGGDGPWSAVRTFATEAALAAPGVVSLSAPADGAVDVPVDVRVSWEVLAGADRYQLQVATNGAFSTLVFDDATLTAPERTLTLEEGTTYYWRVRGANAAGEGPYAAPRSFTTQTTITAPAAVSLSEPADGASGLATALPLRWDAADGATSYDLQVAADPTFAAGSVVVDREALASTSYDVDALSDGTTYHWRVRARNEAGPGPWSPVWSFATLTAAPAAVTLTAPDDAAENLPAEVAVRWEPLATAASYHLQVATDAAFGSLTLDESGLTAPERTLTLSPGTTYYWRVRAANEGGDGPWAATRSFSTATNTALEPTGSTVPGTFGLAQNYPNPFNPTTQIRFDLPRAGQVSLVVVNVAGRVVAHLVDRPLAAGSYEVTLDATALPSGVYVYRLAAGAYVETRRMVLLK